MLANGQKALAPSGAALVGQEMKPDLAALGQVATGLLDVLPVVQRTTAEYAYRRQTTRTNNAAVVAEGAAKTDRRLQRDPGGAVAGGRGPPDRGYSALLVARFHRAGEFLTGFVSAVIAGATTIPLRHAGGDNCSTSCAVSHDPSLQSESRDVTGPVSSRHRGQQRGQAARSVFRYRYSVARLTPRYFAMSLPE